MVKNQASNEPKIPVIEKIWGKLHAEKETEIRKARFFFQFAFSSKNLRNSVLYCFCSLSASPRVSDGKVLAMKIQPLINAQQVRFTARSHPGTFLEVKEMG